MRGRVLIIAGSDTSGGAGLQADIKTVTAFNSYAMTAVTALTAQNTRGVQAVLPVSADFLRQQIVAVMDDIGTDVVKTGMLGSRANVLTVAETIAPHTVLVVDPVLISTSGRPLLDEDAIGVLQADLIPRASLVTPNGPEAARLTGLVVENRDGMRRAADALLASGAGAVLVKGGHIAGDMVDDLLATPRGYEFFSAPRLLGRHMHGTGCTLASAIAASLAQDRELRDAVVIARGYLRRAMRMAPGYGQGNGLLNHAVRVPDARTDCT